MPTSVDGFNPTLQNGILPSISEMEDELNEIFNGYESQFHDALEDPTTQRNKEMLTDVEKTTIQQFVDGYIKLDVQYARPLMEIIKNSSIVYKSGDKQLRHCADVLSANEQATGS